MDKRKRTDAKFNSDKEKNDFHNKRTREQKIEKDMRIIYLEKQLTLCEYKLSESLKSIESLRIIIDNLLKNI